MGIFLEGMWFIFEGRRKAQRPADVAEPLQVLTTVTALQDLCSDIVLQVSLPPETRYLHSRQHIQSEAVYVFGYYKW
jgi:hypothetical protein